MFRTRLLACGILALGIVSSAATNAQHDHEVIYDGALVDWDPFTDIVGELGGARPQDGLMIDDDGRVFVIDPVVQGAVPQNAEDTPTSPTGAPATALTAGQSSRPTPSPGHALPKALASKSVVPPLERFSFQPDLKSGSLLRFDLENQGRPAKKIPLRLDAGTGKRSQRLDSFCGQGENSADQIVVCARFGDAGAEAALFLIDPLAARVLITHRLNDPQTSAYVRGALVNARDQVVLVRSFYDHRRGPVELTELRDARRFALLKSESRSLRQHRPSGNTRLSASKPEPAATAQRLTRPDPALIPASQASSVPDRAQAGRVRNDHSAQSPDRITMLFDGQRIDGALVIAKPASLTLQTDPALGDTAFDARLVTPQGRELRVLTRGKTNPDGTLTLPTRELPTNHSMRLSLRFRHGDADAGIVRAVSHVSLMFRYHALALIDPGPISAQWRSFGLAVPDSFEAPMRTEIRQLGERNVELRVDSALQIAFRVVDPRLPVSGSNPHAAGNLGSAVSQREPATKPQARFLVRVTDAGGNQAQTKLSLPIE